MAFNFKSPRASFWLKAGLAVLLATLADWLFVWHLPGSTVGLFALALVAVLVVTRPGLWRDRRALAAMAAAAGFALVMADRPGFLVWLMFGGAVGVAALSARVKVGEPVWRWAQRLIVAGAVGLIAPLLELLRLSKARRRVGMSGGAVIGRLALPVIGGLLFLGLFAAANPVIAEMLGRLTESPVEELSAPRAFVWGMVGVMVWATLRPTTRRKLIDLPTRAARPTVPEAWATSVIWSLVVFNAVFALQNGLDIAFLWSGAPPPGDVTLADYAHKGAFLLILTALMAGAFVLVALRPGSEMARRPLVRALVMLWTGQTLVLVASCLIRTGDYIDSYALTRVRILALVLMALIGVGLALICWRMVKERSAHWLINANAAVALVALAGISVVDLGAVAAAWNVRHAREVGGRGVELDLNYMRTLGAPALVSLVELETTTDSPQLRDRVTWVRHAIEADVYERQAHWRGWTWREARRLDRIDALGGPSGLPPLPDGFRDYGGSLIPPPISQTPSAPVIVTPADPAAAAIAEPAAPSPVDPTPLTAAEGR